MWQESVKFSLNEGGIITASPFSNNPKLKLLKTTTTTQNPKQNNRNAFSLYKAYVTDTAFGKEDVANLGSLENPPCLPK